MTKRERKERDRKAAAVQKRQSTVAFSQKLLTDLTTTARLYCKGRVRQDGKPLGGAQLILDPITGKTTVRIATHHRAPTKPERRRARRHQVKLRRITMGSFFAQGGRLHEPVDPGLQVSAEAQLAFREGITRREARIRLQDELRERLGYAA